MLCLEIFVRVHLPYEQIRAIKLSCTDLRQTSTGTEEATRAQTSLPHQVPRLCLIRLQVKEVTPPAKVVGPTSAANEWTGSCRPHGPAKPIDGFCRPTGSPSPLAVMELERRQGRLCPAPARPIRCPRHRIEPVEEEGAQRAGSGQRRRRWRERQRAKPEE